MKNRYFKILLILILVIAAIIISGCGKTEETISVSAPSATTNPYYRIDSYNNKGLLMKEAYYGSNPYTVDYCYDETGKLQYSKQSGTGIDRTIYRMNCYYNSNLLSNKIVYDKDGVIEENTSFTYVNGILSKEDCTVYSKSEGKTVTKRYYDATGTLIEESGEGYHTLYSENTKTTYSDVDGIETVTFKEENIYDDNGLLSRVIHLDDVMVYKYNDDGTIDRILTYTPDDSSDSNLKKGEVYEYSEDGKELKVTKYLFFNEKTEIEFVVTHIYDDFGNELCMTTNDKIDFLKEFSYYDNGKIKEIKYLI